MEYDHFWKISAGSLNPRVATEAVTAVAMHGVKSVDYQHYIHLDQVWVLTVALGLAMILGTWAAKRVIEQMAAERWRFVGRPFETVMKRYLQRDCFAGKLS